MSDRARLETAVRDAEAELDAAKTFTAVKEAAKRLQRAKAELKELEGQAPVRSKGRRAS
jgi:ribosomal protein L5